MYRLPCPRSTNPHHKRMRRRIVRLQLRFPRGAWRKRVG
jgi:hypothetical protein